MNDLLGKVRANFDKASGSYESVADIQKKSARMLVDLVLKACPQFFPKSIIDLGTGTGFIPEILLKHFPNSDYILNDISQNMLDIAKAKFLEYENVSYINCDMEVFDFLRASLVTTNFSLQWVCDLGSVIDSVVDRSDVFAFSCLTNRTFHEFATILDSFGIKTETTKYPSVETLLGFLSKYRIIHTEIMSFVVNFGNISEFFGYLKNLGANSTEVRIQPNIIRKIIQEYDEEFSTTYEVFFGIVC